MYTTIIAMLNTSLPQRISVLRQVIKNNIAVLTS
jgi:hypothetical protein